jgi:hypothetical protein
LRELSADNNVLEARYNKVADDVKQLLDEKHALQAAIGELLPREDVFDKISATYVSSLLLVH